jgi:spore coat protein U-like protein
MPGHAVTAQVRIRASYVCVWLLAAAAVPASARAATCDIIPQGVSFGTYDPFEPADLDGVGNIAIACDTDVSVTISLSAGAGSFALRTMNGATGQLTYNLYTGGQRIQVWGDGSGGSDTVSATIRTGDFPVYGRIQARQNVRPGDYSDVIFVTITY